jgi:hypothetical protein
MQRILNRRTGRRVRLRANFVENVADVLVQHAMPRGERREVITGAG